MQPDLHTPRLRLRPFEIADAPAVRELAGDPEVSATALGIPHPFERSVAEAWIASHAEQFEAGRQVNFAITLPDADELCGAVGLTVESEHRRAELGYWIGRAYWGRGIATEAARTVVSYGFEALALRRIHANHLGRNPASGRVLEKLGMRLEGRLRDHVLHRGRFEDLVLYAVLAAEWGEG